MDTLARNELFAKPEVKAAMAEVLEVVRRVLPEGNFAWREQATLAMLEEVGREVLEQELTAIAGSFPDRILINGVEYKRHEPGTDGYFSLSGKLNVRRETFRQVGVHNGPIVVPLELAAGLIEGATPALAFNVAHGYGQHDMRLHGRMLEMAHRTPPPRATLERLAKRIATKAVNAAPRLEPLLRQAESLPEGARGVVIGLDRGSVPMAEPRHVEAPPKPEKRRSPRIRKAPPPYDVNWRMAYVGTFSVVNESGEALVTRRYAIPACDDPTTLVNKLAADVRTARRKDPTLNVGTVQDGAPELWNLTRAALSRLSRNGVIGEWQEGIDRCHLAERLGKALQIFEKDEAERKRQLAEWSDWLDTRDSAIDSIERVLLQRREALPADQQNALDEHLVYIANNKDRMRYVTLATSNLPIGSGVTESAAKTVIGRRTKNAGQRWKEPGLRGALNLRAIDQSDRLPRFWSYLSRRYTAVVEAA